MRASLTWVLWLSMALLALASAASADEGSTWAPVTLLEIDDATGDAGIGYDVAGTAGVVPAGQGAAIDIEHVRLMFATPGHLALDIRTVHSDGVDVVDYGVRGCNLALVVGAVRYSAWVDLTRQVLPKITTDDHRERTLPPVKETTDGALRTLLPLEVFGLHGGGMDPSAALQILSLQCTAFTARVTGQYNVTAGFFDVLDAAPLTTTLDNGLPAPASRSIDADPSRLGPEQVWLHGTPIARGEWSRLAWTGPLPSDTNATVQAWTAEGMLVALEHRWNVTSEDRNLLWVRVAADLEAEHLGLVVASQEEGQTWAVATPLRVGAGGSLNRWVPFFAGPPEHGDFHAVRWGASVPEGASQAACCGRFDPVYYTLGIFDTDDRGPLTQVDTPVGTLMRFDETSPPVLTMRFEGPGQEVDLQVEWMTYDGRRTLAVFDVSGPTGQDITVTPDTWNTNTTFIGATALFLRGYPWVGPEWDLSASSLEWHGIPYDPEPAAVEEAPARDVFEDAPGAMPAPLLVTLLALALLARRRPPSARI